MSDSITSTSAAHADSPVVNAPLDYAQYYQQFDKQALMTQIFADHPEDALNAYMACCGRHVRNGLGEKFALVHEDCEQNVSTLTFNELAEKSAQVANQLKAYGVKAGDRVATMLPRTPELLIVVMATWRIGAIYQPLFTAFGYESIAYRLDKADTKVVFTNVDNRAKFDEINHLPTMVVVENQAAVDASVYEDDIFAQAWQQSSECEPVELTPDATFLQMFTSGTVGKSKGVSVPLAALPTFYLYMRYAIDLRDNDNYWNMADPGWAYGLYYGITGPLLMGVTTYFNEAGFDAQNTLDFLTRHNISNIASSPTAFRMMKSSGIFDHAADKLSLRVANSAGETLNTEVVGWVNEHLGCPIYDQYGQTETGMTCCMHHALSHDVPTGCMGLPLPGHTLVVVDENMQPVTDGVPGQLAVVVSESPAFYFNGYSWNEKQAFEGDYYLTGDMVERHDDGTFWFVGRDDDIIISAGYRIGPTDVENCVMAHDAVAESAAVGVPDEVRGHVVKSFVVLKKGVEASDALVQEIKSLVHQRLSAHAYPRQVAFVDALPKTPSGKIQRFILRQLG
ncbi:AMP-binding protein [Psychrobacter sp. FDAARGOS_221]|uniref:AMP-binding protein n=1 Tax=Psychrobacter sp. FDAARGOS_221 TaxID=1975705 RepID=UPI000BB52EEF|nr:AMP-binding protein [Psychrobacter sp. FDAARGOS_221]PNK61626.1 AMP-binding protein [Psychrobacter sp. FDAARGOS_221]